MRILVISDSHGYRQKLGTLLMKAESTGELNAVVHLGDGYLDMKPYEEHLPPLYVTPGNCDGDRGTVLCPELDGVKVLMTHGHALHVKMGLDALLMRAVREEATVALFGHTHRPFCQERAGVLLVNPGAAMNGHFAVLTVENGGAYAEMY